MAGGDRFAAAAQISWAAWGPQQGLAPHQMLLAPGMSAPGSQLPAALNLEAYAA